VLLGSKFALSSLDEDEERREREGRGEGGYERRRRRGVYPNEEELLVQRLLR
jgi:hypothetical protein